FSPLQCHVLLLHARFLPQLVDSPAVLSTTTTAVTNLVFFFFFNDTATTEIYTLSLHDALPISSLLVRLVVLLPFQLLRLSLATPSRWTPLALSVFLHCVVALLLTLL